MDTCRFLLRKLLEDRVAFLGALLIVLLIVAAVFAPLLYPNLALLGALGAWHFLDRLPPRE